MTAVFPPAFGDAKSAAKQEASAFDGCLIDLPPPDPNGCLKTAFAYFRNRGTMFKSPYAMSRYA